MDPQIQAPLPAQVPVKKNKSKLLLIIVVVIAVLLLVGLVAIYVSASNKSKQQSSSIAKQQAQITDQQTEIDKLKQGIDDSQIVIAELGLQYPKTPENLNIVYIVDLKDKNKPGLFMTSKSLMVSQLNASRLVPPPQKNACGAAESPAGTITFYKSDDTINGQKVTDVKSADLRKIGDNYYYYQSSPVVCSLNSDVQNEQKKSTEQARKLFNSLVL